ncbi:hypothetical protein CUJ84_pRLN3000165 (plasmid) [Rhizobium leguminosarum]|uniref:Uncharacterized protein n=1 Tax=Rhizobium leguminosarum TaxID=384 RepID=A0A2K9ZGF2_RHILE|nr:hypothetical protein CUJ84_pRLN3000165 [Rhizobium leguminosarum]
MPTDSSADATLKLERLHKRKGIPSLPRGIVFPIARAGWLGAGASPIGYGSLRVKPLELMK